MTVIGTLISERYRLEEKIGSGGMSSVYRAFDPTLERWVAIKLMHRDISNDPDQLERFRREARAVAQLNHPHVVTVIDAGEDDGNPYIVFEYVEGETLKERIRRLGRLPVAEAVAYAIEIGRALECAHENKLVHRDVKPQNVLIDRDGRAKVTDFGIARSLEAQGLTATGRVLGTTDYVSPEQALGHEVTGQSDIYSLGIVLYEMLTGETPFQADTQVAVAMKHVRDPLPDAQRRRPEISSALAAVVERSTAKETQNRYPTVSQMVHDLEEVLAIEAARSGQTTGEATTVLQSLSGDTADFAPIRLRRPKRALALTVLRTGAAGGDRDLPRAADREGHRRHGREEARRAERGAAGRRRRARLRPGGRRPRVGGRHPLRHRRRSRHQLEHRALRGRLRGQQQQARRGDLRGCRQADRGTRPRAHHRHPGLQGQGLRLGDRAGVDQRVGSGEPRRERRAGPHLPAEDEGTQVPQLPALDHGAAGAEQGRRSRNSAC